RSLWRERIEPCAVRDPVHVRKQLVWEPGYPALYCSMLGSARGSAHREAFGRTTMSDRRGKSDCCAVPQRPPNKAAGESSVAVEAVEGRRQAKGNAITAHMSPTPRRAYDMGSALDGTNQRLIVTT